MLKIDKILEKIETKTNILDVSQGEVLKIPESAGGLLIAEGKMLAYADNKLTQTFRAMDPLNIAETVARKEGLLEFKALANTSLIEFGGDDLRKEVARAGAVSASIIKYSLSRIFETRSKQNNYKFEDQFLNKNLKILNQVAFGVGDAIFNQGDVADSMFYIEIGSVKLLATTGEELATLKSGECFGEAALINDNGRMCSAIANERTALFAINRDLLFEEISKDSPLTQLVVVSLIKRLELMNKLRWASDFTK
ncbi:cyclic nucleotide-binding domain-containing protein [Alphaproteobacteria bacterium]|jgi:hypothetical protein|nr:cyclic nucleotide-binding domain-containing protein [Alphaproteobacteria bacterium]